MADGPRSVVARAAVKFAAYVGGLPSESSWWSWSSFSTYSRTEKIQEDTKRLIRRLDAIRARLDDAEQMEITDGYVRHWLRKLEALAHDADDVLDEFAYEAMRLGLMEDGEPKHGAADPPTLELRDFEQKIGKISSSFDEIMKHKQALWSEEGYGHRQVVETPVKGPTSSLMEEPHIFGREKDLEEVKRFLLSDEVSGCCNSTVPAMAIVGMGGLGKTTLAQLAYNDDEVEKYFPLRSWVSVSQGVDLVQLTEAILQSLSLEASGLSELNPLQMKLKEKLGGNRFLLVLDDVWEVENLSSIWGRLTAPFRHKSAGRKIIITTRSWKVSKMSGAISTYHLPYLEEGACLELFSQHAFERGDLNSNPNLKAIGRRISKKCRGLPLLAKTLGGLLCHEDDEGMWNDILESNIWDIGEEKKIMDILALSYQHLPAHLKRCFRYCSVFPKDYEFDRDQLVRMWMAHGYVLAEGLKLMEDVGNQYFNDLLCRSFFQHSQKPHTFLMHDLIHDLARSASQGECYSVEEDKRYNIPGDLVRHISVVTNKTPRRIVPLEDISVSGTIRSFLFINTSLTWHRHIKLESDLFTRMENLRLLDLGYTGLEELPSSISFLKHLRYLGLRANPIKQLPESVGSLYHLQTLDLQFCASFVGFSVSISNLSNLRHLMHENLKFAYPVGIGRLTNLQSMPAFYVSQNLGHARLGELKDINNIRSLLIYKINMLTDMDDAKKACLEKKEHLRVLKLKWEAYSFRLSYKEVIEDEVLESLKPCSKLERLTICFFWGQSIPSWLGHPAFYNLASVELIGCKYWTFLPPLGQLPSLKWLSISMAGRVEYIGDEFFCGGFPRLETLRLECLDSWKSWCGAREGECPRLRELVIGECNSLDSLSLTNLDALESLKIKDCHKLYFSNEVQLPSALQVLSIHGCPLLMKWCQQYRQRLLHISLLDIQGMDAHVVLYNVFCVQEAAEACLEVRKRLHTLELVWDCNDGNGSFRDVGPEEVLQNLRPHANLNKLVIQGYTGSRFAAWLGDPSFSNLVYVTLRGCSQCELLPPLGQLPHLMELYIVGGHLLRCIGSEFFNSNSTTGGTRAFPYLEKLEFNDMSNWEEWVEVEDGYLPCLHVLILKHCPRLRALPRLPPSLMELEVANCDVITFPHSFSHLSSLRTLRISQLPVLQKLPDLPLGLMRLTVQCAPSLIDLVTPPSLRGLVLEGCSETMVAASLPHLTHLTSLHIYNFPELIKLPLHNLVILCELRVCNCPQLVSFDCFSFSQALGEYIEGLQALKSLESLSISDCPRLYFSANERPPSSLRSMAITNGPSLAAWHDEHWRSHVGNQ